MKKILCALAGCFTVTAMAQTKGRIEVYDFGAFRLHVYYTNDALGDASYIVEGESAVVTMEQPLFRENVVEFDAYLDRLGKPVEQRIADYHLGGTGDSDYVMADGMPEFSEGAVYGGMMRDFRKMFGDAMAELPTGRVSVVAFDDTCRWAGVDFTFRHGAATDFPAASILIGDKVRYTHWAPEKAHASHLQIASPEALDAEIAEIGKALASGCELFAGGHGGAVGIDAARFRSGYLKTVKRLLAEHADAASFAAALKAAYPGLPGEAGIDGLAGALYR